jgi:cysteine desulfurase
MKPAVYLDHAATTPVRPEVREAMLPFLGEAFGNPSSPHRYGRAARAGLEQARRQVAEAIGAEPNQVFFTSGGTEADNLAVVGAALAARDRGAPMLAVAPATEHKAVLASLHAVRRFGGAERVLPVAASGVLEHDALDPVLAERPAVVSVMWVNNETGVIQPVEAIATRCADAGVAFHSDAVQAFGKVPVSLRAMPGAMLTLSGHKIGAPKGIGALIVGRPGVVDPIIHGGGQQSGLRPGTENVAGAVALGRAAELAAAELTVEAARLAGLRDRLAGVIAAAVPDAVFNGAGPSAAPHVLNVSVPGTDGEALLMHLDLAGVAASGGSACTTGSVEPSHVLSAMGLPRNIALGTVRFSLGHGSRPEDVDRVAAVFPDIVRKVRELAVVLGRA